MLYDDVVVSDKDIESSEAIKLTATADGVHHFCLENKDSEVKHVKFDLLVEKPDHRVNQMTFEEKTHHAKGETLSKMAEELGELSKTVAECKQMQEYHREREAINHNSKCPKKCLCLLPAS